MPFGNIVPYVCVQALDMPRSKNGSGVYRPNYNPPSFFACFSQHLYALTWRCGTDVSGRGTLEAPTENGARTKLFIQQF